MTTDEINRVLLCPMQGNSADAATVGEYLSLLLSTLWLQGEGFNGKRPHGNSGWEWEIYEALGRNGIIYGITFDEDGYIEDLPNSARLTADEVILQVIRSMGKAR